MKKIKQFRYYGSTDTRNYPENINNYWGTLVRGNLFKTHSGITHLGIQGIPGTKFYLNNSLFPITIGFTGIYELILKDNGSIHAIQFDEETLSWYDEEDKEDRLIIDIIYEGGV